MGNSTVLHKYYSPAVTEVEYKTPKITNPSANSNTSTPTVAIMQKQAPK